MEQKGNILAEASTHERASSSTSAPQPEPADEFDPVPLRYRFDGWTPRKQREFVEALAETGIIRHAAAQVGMSEQSVGRLRRRAEARAFDLACEAAQRIGARRLVSVAVERAIEGTVRQLHYHGEVTGEERVYDNRLLTYLIGRLGAALEPRRESFEVEANWDGWMEAIEEGGPPPRRSEQEDEFDGSEVWETGGTYWTSFPPPPDFDGEESTTGLGAYCRTLSDAELAVIEGDLARQTKIEEARRDRFFSSGTGEDSASWQAEPSTPSAPRPPAQLPPPDARSAARAMD